MIFVQLMVVGIPQSAIQAPFNDLIPKSLEVGDLVADVRGKYLGKLKEIQGNRCYVKFEKRKNEPAATKLLDRNEILSVSEC